MSGGVSMSDGGIDDVRTVYDALTDEEKGFVTPHRTVYKDVPPLSRTVAYSGGVPVGFADLYGKKGRASLCLAVAKAARGNGLAGEMARTSIRKLLNAMAEEKRRAREAGGSELDAWRSQPRIRRFVWGLDARNDRSARSAERAGFTEQEFKRPHKFRRFVMTRGEAERMLSGREEKRAADIPSIYEDVRRAYGDMGYPIAGDRLVVSEQPTYTNGKPVPADVMAPEVSGGNTQYDGTIRINPNYRSVMRRWGLKGSGSDFLRMIIGHELGHHVDRTLLRTRARSAERRRLLDEISRSGFHTVYTDSYGPGTDRRKLDKELLAEYLARRVADRLSNARRYGHVH